MSLIAGVEEPVLFDWGPASALPALLGTATYGGQVDLNNTGNELSLHTFTDGKLNKLVKCDIPSGCHAFSWVDTDPGSLGKIVLGLEDGNLFIYSPQSLLENSDPILHRCTRHTGTVGALDWNPFQHNLLASGAQSSEIYIWDMNSCEKPMTPGAKIQPHSPVRCVAWNIKIQHILGSLFGLPSGTQAVVWDLRKNEPIIKVQDRSSRLSASAMVWNPGNPTQFAVGSEDDERPIIQLWDVRQAQQPYQTIAGHDKGITSLQWHRTDERLLLAGGKDGRTCIFNVVDGSLVSEMPRQPGFCLSTKFNPRHPSLVTVASVEGGTQIYNMMGEPSAPKLQSQKQVAALDDAFGTLDNTTAPPVTTDDLERPEACTLPPAWFGKRVGASFGFGGKMIQWTRSGDKSNVEIKQIITEPSAVEESKKLLTALESDIEAYCEEKLKNIKSPVDANIWKYIQARCSPDRRAKIIQLLGINETSVEQPAQDDLEVEAEPEPEATPTEPVEPEPQTDDTYDMVDAEVEENTKVDEDDPFANISQGNAEITPPNIPPEVTVDESEIQLNTAETVTQDKSDFIDSACHSPVFCIPSGPANDIDIVVTNSLLLADFKTAVNVCLDGNRISDALVIAKIGGEELLEQTIEAYHRKNTSKISRLVETVYKKNWTDIVCGCELANWKEALSALMTYCNDEELTAFIDQLGSRLEDDQEFYQQAALCFIISGNIDRLVTTIRRFINTGTTADDLQELVEKILILRKSANCDLGAISSGILQEYAMLLSSQGEFESSLSFCTGENDKLVQLRSRIEHNTTVVKPIPVVAEPVAASNLAAAPAVNHMAPAVNNMVPAVASAPKNAFSRPKPNRAVKSMVPTQPSFTPQPVPVAPQPVAPTSFNPQPVAPTSFAAQPVAPATFAPQPVNPSVSNPMAPQPGLNQMPGGYPSMSINQPAPVVQNPPTSFQPVPSSGYQPNSGYQPPGGNMYGGSMYAQADISHIPKGPAPDKKESTAGWNDPGNKPEYAKPVEPSMRIRKSKKTTPAPAFNPTEMPMFTPQAMPQGGGMLGQPPMGMMPPMGHQPMGAQLPPMGQSPMMQPAPTTLTSMAPNVGQPSPFMQGNIPTSGSMMQPMMNQPNQPANTNGAGEPAEPLGPNSGAAQVQKPPLPEQYEPMKAAFDGLLTRCRSAPAVNAVLKKKLDDAQKRLNSLYDKLRKNSLSQLVVDGLTQISDAAEKHDYSRGLGLVQWIVQKANFSEVSSFLPGIKNLLQIGAQLKV